ILRTFTRLKKRVEDFRETLTTEIKHLKKNQSGMKHAITEIGNRFDSMNTRLEEADELVSEREDKIMGHNEAKPKRENYGIEERLGELRDTIKYNNIFIIGILGDREKRAENLLEGIIAENSSNLGKETDIQIQETQRTPIKINKSRPMP
ncbi:LORF1 protein, partial [Crocuta crocuta]